MKTTDVNPLDFILGEFNVTDSAGIIPDALPRTIYKDALEIVSEALRQVCDHQAIADD